MGRSLSPSFFNTKTLKPVMWLHFKGNFKWGATGCPRCGHIMGGNKFHSTMTQKDMIFVSSLIAISAMKSICLPVTYYTFNMLVELLDALGIALMSMYTVW